MALDSVDSVVKEAAGETAATAAEQTVSATAKEPEKPDYQDGGRDPAGNGHLDANAGRDLSGYFRLRHLPGRSEPGDHSHRRPRSSTLSTLQALWKPTARIEELEADNSVLNSYKVQTEQYTKTGLLYFDEYDVPVYGYAVGEVLNEGDGQRRGNGQAGRFDGTWSAGRLNFWQAGIVAYYANNKMYVTDGEFLQLIADRGLDHHHNGRATWT